MENYNKYLIQLITLIDTIHDFCINNENKFKSLLKYDIKTFQHIVLSLIKSIKNNNINSTGTGIIELKNSNYKNTLINNIYQSNTIWNKPINKIENNIVNYTENILQKKNLIKSTPFIPIEIMELNTNNPILNNNKINLILGILNKDDLINFNNKQNKLYDTLIDLSFDKNINIIEKNIMFIADADPLFNKNTEDFLCIKRENNNGKQTLYQGIFSIFDAGSKQKSKSNCIKHDSVSYSLSKNDKELLFVNKIECKNNNIYRTINNTTEKILDLNYLNLQQNNLGNFIQLICLIESSLLKNNDNENSIKTYYYELIQNLGLKYLFDLYKIKLKTKIITRKKIGKKFQQVLKNNNINNIVNTSLKINIKTQLISNYNYELNDLDTNKNKIKIQIENIKTNYKNIFFKYYYTGNTINRKNQKIQDLFTKIEEILNRYKHQLIIQEYFEFKKKTIPLDKSGINIKKYILEDINDYCKKNFIIGPIDISQFNTDIYNIIQLYNENIRIKYEKNEKIFALNEILIERMIIDELIQLKINYIRNNINLLENIDKLKISSNINEYDSLTSHDFCLALFDFKRSMDFLQVKACIASNEADPTTNHVFISNDRIAILFGLLNNCTCIKTHNNKDTGITLSLLNYQKKIDISSLTKEDINTSKSQINAISNNTPNNNSSNYNSNDDYNVVDLIHRGIYDNSNDNTQTKNRNQKKRKKQILFKDLYNKGFKDGKDGKNEDLINFGKINLINEASDDVKFSEKCAEAYNIGYKDGKKEKYNININSKFNVINTLINSDQKQKLKNILKNVKKFGTDYINSLHMEDKEHQEELIESIVESIENANLKRKLLEKIETELNSIILSQTGGSDNNRQQMSVTIPTKLQTKYTQTQLTSKIQNNQVKLNKQKEEIKLLNSIKKQVNLQEPTYDLDKEIELDMLILLFNKEKLFVEFLQIYKKAFSDKMSVFMYISYHSIFFLINKQYPEAENLRYILSKQQINNQQTNKQQINNQQTNKQQVNNQQTN
jgi:hypothetical protein